MKKSELKTGMVLELRDGAFFMVLLGDIPTTHYGTQELMFVSHDGFIRGSNYTEDLTSQSFSDLDVVKVYQPNVSNLNSLFGKDKLNKECLVWERKELCAIAGFEEGVIYQHKDALNGLYRLVRKPAHNCDCCGTLIPSKTTVLCTFYGVDSIWTESCYDTDNTTKKFIKTDLTID